MKKRLLAVFLSVAIVLAFFAVPALTASGESTLFTGSNPNVLRQLLDEGDVTLSTTGNLGIFVHHSPFVIPAGRTLTVITTLNVQGNARLVIEGTLIVAEGGRINNQGGSGGTIDIVRGGTLINYGHVENVTNSTVINCGTIINNNRFEIRAGTTFYDCGYTVGSLNVHRNAILAECERCAAEVNINVVIDESGVIFDGNDIVYVPANVHEFLYVRVVEGPRAHVMHAQRTGYEASWVHTRVAQPTWVDIIIATISEDNLERAATVLPESRVARDVPEFDFNLQRLPDRTRVLITVVVASDSAYQFITEYVYEYEEYYEYEYDYEYEEYYNYEYDNGYEYDEDLLDLDDDD